MIASTRPHDRARRYGLVALEDDENFESVGGGDADGGGASGDPELDELRAEMRKLLNTHLELHETAGSAQLAAMHAVVAESRGWDVDFARARTAAHAANAIDNSDMHTEADVIEDHNTWGLPAAQLMRAHVTATWDGPLRRRFCGAARCPVREPAGVPARIPRERARDRRRTGSTSTPRSRPPSTTPRAK